MAKEKRLLLGGMDKDSDLRLIKNGDYKSAVNARVAKIIKKMFLKLLLNFIVSPKFCKQYFKLSCIIQALIIQ